MTENQSIINLINYCSRSYISVAFSNFLYALLQEVASAAFVHLSIMFLLYTALHDQRSKSSHFFVFHTSESISSRPATFLRLVVLRTVINSSILKCPILISSWPLIISLVDLSDFRRVSHQILEMFFPHLKPFFLAGRFLILILRCFFFP